MTAGTIQMGHSMKIDTPMSGQPIYDQFIFPGGAALFASRLVQWLRVVDRPRPNAPEIVQIELRVDLPNRWPDS